MREMLSCVLFQEKIFYVLDQNISPCDQKHLSIMVVRLRLALPPTNLRRPDHRTFPRFNIVAIESQTRRDAKPIEKLGEWGVVRRKVSKPGDKVLQSISPEFVDGGKGKGKAREGVEEAEQTLPFDAKTGDRRGRLEKRVIWNVDRINYWLGTGAQPSERVAWLLDQVSPVLLYLFVQYLMAPMNFPFRCISHLTLQAGLSKPISRQSLPAGREI